MPWNPTSARLFLFGAALLVAPPASASPSAGYADVSAKRLLIFNCNTEKDPRTYWVLDSATNAWRKVYTAPYDGPESFGSCPTEGRQPFVFVLEPGVSYQVWAYDDGSEHPGQCSASDPRQPPLMNCLDWWIGPVVGSADGQDLLVNFP